MPRPPTFAPAVAAMPGAVYSPFADRPADAGRSLVPLHVGDTWLEACEDARSEELRADEHPDLHRYGPTGGVPALVDAVVEKLRAHNGLAVERENVLVTAGATSGLACAVSAIVSPGDEVLILAPFWPLIRGIVQSQRAIAVEVPFYDRVESAGDALAAIRAQASERTVALYVSSPSNPTGRVLPRAWLERLAELAQSEGWWLLSDEAYEALVYRGEHWSMGQAAPERCLTVHSFSKTYGMAGYRVGTLAGPARWVAEAHKVSVHTAYHAPTAAQQLALRVLRGDSGQRWLERARTLYAQAGSRAARALGLREPEGSTFLFVDVKAALDERGIDGFLADCYDDGVLVAPGASAGRDYPNWVRLCYTAAPPDEVARAVDCLAARLQPALR